jgi:hypothetical protein
MRTKRASARTICNGLLFSRLISDTHFRFGVDSRTAEIFQEPGKADAPLFGSRAGPADGRRWVETRMAAPNNPFE